MEQSSAPKRNKFECDKCNQIFNRRERLRKHQNGNKTKCYHCSLTFCNHDGLQKHFRSIATPVTEIPDIHLPIQPRTSYGGDAGYQAVKLGKLHEITDWTKQGINYEIINHAINHKFTYKMLQNWLMEIYRKHQSGFKISLSFGFVLFNPVMNVYRYYYASDNNALFDRAYTIDSIGDVEKLMKKIAGVDLTTNCYLQKPSSGWVLSNITNIQAKITDIKRVLIGGGEIPSYIRNMKSVIKLTHNRGDQYN